MLTETVCHSPTMMRAKAQSSTNSYPYHETESSLQPLRCEIAQAFAGMPSMERDGTGCQKAGRELAGAMLLASQHMEVALDTLRLVVLAKCW